LKIIRDNFLNQCVYIHFGDFIAMKKENCPFCGHRWTRSSQESPVECPNCHSKFYTQEELAEREFERDQI